MSAHRKWNVIGLGNALVDILAPVGDEVVIELGLNKGSMTLVEGDLRTRILDRVESSSKGKRCGGSAANSLIAIAQSGGFGVFVGKVADDALGVEFAEDMRGSGIHYDVPPASGGSIPTGTSIILTTPDAERTMCTNLGISVFLAPEDVPENLLAQSEFLYIEGYLWSGDATREAAWHAMKLARKHGVKIAFTFSDSFLVHAFRDSFKELLGTWVDVVFCNADEARALCGESDLSACGAMLSKQVSVALITDGSEGAWVLEEGKFTHVPGFPVKALDTVGAGDAFAGGVLYGMAHGFSAKQSARWGNYLASQVVQVQGPRLDQPELPDPASVIRQN
jgi:sugar/nucleoside kinase (ribokinase family)